MKEMPKKDPPVVSGGYISPDDSTGTCIPTPWTPMEPDPLATPESSIAPCESPNP